MIKSKRHGTVRFPVAEVDDILASLRDARVVKDLGGQQRQRLADAWEDLRAARMKATGGFVNVPIGTFTQVLRCIPMILPWLDERFTDFFGC